MGNSKVGGNEPIFSNARFSFDSVSKTVVANGQVLALTPVGIASFSISKDLKTCDGFRLDAWVQRSGKTQRIHLDAHPTITADDSRVLVWGLKDAAKQPDPGDYPMPMLAWDLNKPSGENLMRWQYDTFPAQDHDPASIPRHSGDLIWRAAATGNQLKVACSGPLSIEWHANAANARILEVTGGEDSLWILTEDGLYQADSERITARTMASQNPLRTFACAVKSLFGWSKPIFGH
jgi:hypothetical protein